MLTPIPRPFFPRACLCVICVSVEVGRRRPGLSDPTLHVRSLRILRGPCAVDTCHDVPLALNPQACGPNLFLHHGHLTVTNLIHKKWNSVRCTAGFSSGQCHMCNGCFGATPHRCV